jgi:hypothetical protein
MAVQMPGLHKSYTSPMVAARIEFLCICKTSILARFPLEHAVYTTSESFSEHIPLTILINFLAALNMALYYCIRYI